ncbi:MAG: DNA polymerase III subunit gamma/tau [Anaerolineales bacterium]|nr:DNA polymerase III subunit gamma/tau [Anaerolineales bacterium]
MSAQALYRKWRPQLWDEVVGQDHVVQTLRHAIAHEHVAHAYLFSGPRGCGKTTSARLVAKGVNCLNADPAQRPCNACAHCLAVNEGRFLDLIEIDGASNNSVENIRDLRDKINFSPGQGRYKVYIIDEVHMLSLGAFNALLKTLEEPPPHAIFILATTENYKVPATVASRCQKFEFRRIPVVDIVTRLQTVCAHEGITAEPAALELVARQATGALRDAESLLDQLIAAGSASTGGGAAVTLAHAQALLGAALSQTVQDLTSALAVADTARGLRLIQAAVDAGADPRQLARQMVDYLRQLMLIRLGNGALVDATTEVRATMAQQAQGWAPAALLRGIRLFNTAAGETRAGWQPQLPLELAVLECATPPEEPAAVQPTLAASTASGAARPQPTRAFSPEPDAPAAAGSASDDPRDLGQVWRRAADLLLERRKITALTKTDLDRCGVVGLHEGEFRVRATRAFIDRLQNRPEFAGTLGQAVTEVLGRAVRIVFQQGDGPARAAGGSAPPGSLAAAAIDLGGELVE